MKGPEADKIEKLFDSIAGDYDRLNHLLSMGTDRCWRRRAVKEILADGKPLDILDVACGTGDFSIDIASAAPARATITGIDLSEGMLAVMREKVRRKGLENSIKMMQGNCESLPFADEYFDCVCIAFGIRNFEHRDIALREILRVLRPGCKLVILELSVPEAPVLRRAYNLYFTKVLPFIGGMISGDKAAYRYLPASVLNFPGPAKWTAFMESCGLRSVTHKALTFGICRMYTGVK